MGEITPASDVPRWHRNLLAAAAIFSVLLIGMGGILCVTQSIRGCPDWPGCFGRILPPLQSGPILEVLHRFLAGSSGLLIFASAVVGLIRKPRLGWLVVPALASCLLVLEVSYFGAMVVLHGLALGWAAVDFASALLVVALMVTAAVVAHVLHRNPGSQIGLSFRSPLALLGLVTLAAMYVVLFTGILVGGKGSITPCLGWPVYSLQLIRLDSPGLGNLLRLILSILTLVLMAAFFLRIVQQRVRHPEVFNLARWALLSILLEALLQVLLLSIGFRLSILIPYTLCTAGMWGLATALTARAATVIHYESR